MRDQNVAGNSNNILGVLDEAGAGDSSNASNCIVNRHGEQRAGMIEEEKIERQNNEESLGQL